MKVLVENTEPCWVRYMFEVELPDDTPEAEIEEEALLRLTAPSTLVSGPDVRGTIEGMDQDYAVREVLR